MPKLEVKGITKVYKKGAVKALDDFTVTLNNRNKRRPPHRSSRFYAHRFNRY